jgi:Zn-dependent M28 family amino/carboxypeptidase
MTRTTSRRARTVALAAAGAMALAGTVALAGPAVATPGGATACEKRTNDTVAELTHCVTLDGVMEHLEEFQAIAGAPENAGTRASGTPGYTASADYVHERLDAAGWTVTRQQFDFPFFELRSSSFSRVAPTPTPYQVDTDYAPMTYTGSGTVDDRAVTPVDIDSATSGCEAEDFAGFASGTVALVQRGTCPFGVKAANAQTAGAAAVIVFNNVEGPLNGTLGAPGVTVPVIGVPTTLGRDLAAGGTTVDLAVDATSEIRTTENVVAELPGSTSDNVVMAGAHLDSVPAGPGINDNGSGSAALVEIAENMAEVDLPNTVRFAWWGAEELGLLGSRAYVRGLTPEARRDIAVLINSDMLGSPNAAYLVYDGDDSDRQGAPPGPAGSDGIERTLAAALSATGVQPRGTDFDGRSDYGPFIEAGIPAGGLYTGAEDIKTPEEAAVWGGQAGLAYDRCYHQACDTTANIDRVALDRMLDTLAVGVGTYAVDLGGPNGVPTREQRQTR